MPKFTVFIRVKAIVPDVQTLDDARLMAFHCVSKALREIPKARCRAEITSAGNVSGATPAYDDA